MNHEGIVLSGNTLVLLLILLLLGVTGYLIYKISVLQKEKKALTEEKKSAEKQVGKYPFGLYRDKAQSASF